MGVFKEEAYAFEQIEKQAVRIWNDSCDCGVPYNTENIPTNVKMVIDAVKEFQELDKKYPYEKPFIIERNTWMENTSSSGVSVKIQIAWEVDEGMECGSEYIVSFSKLPKTSNPSFLHKGKNAFISVTSGRYRIPYKKVR